MNPSNNESQQSPTNSQNIEENLSEENLFDIEISYQVPSSPLAPPNSPQQDLDLTINGTGTTSAITPLAIVVPDSTRPSSSRVSPFFIAPRSLIHRRPRTGPPRTPPTFTIPQRFMRHPPPMTIEPATQRRRVHDDLATLQHTVHAMDQERVEMIEDFNHLYDRQVRIEDDITALRLRIEASARREETLREDLDESQRSIARLKESMRPLEENLKKILEERGTKTEADTHPSTSHP